MKTSIQTAPHSRWQSVCDAWALTDSDDLSVKQEAMPPGTCETPHFHRVARQFFYVLSGVLTMKIGDKSHNLTSNEGLEIPPGQLHQARNDSADPVSFLVISAPSTAQDRIEP